MSEPLLPPEVLYLIFCQLPAQHLKNALLVCWRWRQVGEATGFWRNVNLRVTRENIRLMPEVLGARRMLEVREITVEDVGEVEQVEELLLAISLHRGVTRLNLAGTNLTTVEPKLLTRAVGKMDRLKVHAARLTTQQIEAILVALGKAWNLAQALNGQDF